MQGETFNKCWKRNECRGKGRASKSKTTSCLYLRCNDFLEGKLLECGQSSIRYNMHCTCIIISYLDVPLSGRGYFAGCPFVSKLSNLCERIGGEVLYDWCWRLLWLMWSLIGGNVLRSSNLHLVATPMQPPNLCAKHHNCVFYKLYHMLMICIFGL